MPVKAYYNAPISRFLVDDDERILGVLATEHHHALEEEQRRAWHQQILILKSALSHRPDGKIFIEFYIPRMGKRADAVLITGHIVFVIEFKVGATEHSSSAFDQVEDYALDLKNFHEGSHAAPIVPILVSTHAESHPLPELEYALDLVASPIATNQAELGVSIQTICESRAFPTLDVDEWMSKGYKPTPTIVEAAEVLYRTHSVADIRRRDASDKNLDETSASVSRVIGRARDNRIKAICFIAAVPGSGKKLPEYGSQGQVHKFLASTRVHSDEHLHLAVSMRSFRAETLSEFIGHVVDNEPKAARMIYEQIAADYPIYLTRRLSTTKAWLRNKARGTERFGLVASSGAQRLRPEGIHIKAEIGPANWFLNRSNDVRSSYYLEDVATEFDVQGLELDWVGVCWDGDFHHNTKRRMKIK